MTVELGRESPYASLYRDMIASAVAARASDIHIQPEREGVEIRFRIHGDLTPWKWIPAAHKSAMLQEAKQLSQCSLAIAGRAQDARLSFPDLKLDVRVNLVPSLHGEKLVLRLLDQTRQFNLNAIGLEAGAVQAIERALEHRTGVNLITGPTGSGKTTLLYSALASLDRKRLNIVTIEDPVEYTFPGITQMQVTPKLAFADALRAMLRQDPDVILVGEVRDSVTADLCFQAAATGHLVLSTLHANNATEVRRRLSGLGVREDLTTSCLRFSSAQRLMGKLCAHCRLPLDDTDRRRGIGLLGQVEEFRKRNANGCNQCARGVTSRVPVFEYVESARQTDDLPPSPGYSLRDAALALARRGEVDVFEALHVE
jgi:type II secretory ATPase GspE/PulE/Tfp pilus assembly ATPase PilB-like protein